MNRGGIIQFDIAIVLVFKLINTFSLLSLIELWHWDFLFVFFYICWGSILLNFRVRNFESKGECTSLLTRRAIQATVGVLDYWGRRQLLIVSLLWWIENSASGAWDSLLSATKSVLQATSFWGWLTRRNILKFNDVKIIFLM